MFLMAVFRQTRLAIQYSNVTEVDFGVFFGVVGLFAKTKMQFIIPGRTIQTGMTNLLCFGII